MRADYETLVLVLRVCLMRAHLLSVVNTMNQRKCSGKERRHVRMLARRLNVLRSVLLVNPSFRMTSGMVKSRKDEKLSLHLL